MSAVVGSRIGPYEIVALLGAGGMGEVYRARDIRLGREVAVKILPTNLVHDVNRLERFEREARAAGALNHPNVLAVYDIGTHAGTPYVVSELLEGETLRARIAEQPLPVRKALDYALQIAHGLAAAHEKGIIHRDLKPENIFITRDRRVKILDFGLAKLKPLEGADSGSAVTTGAETVSGVVLGTVGYMSPEQVRGRAVDHRADIFSFGAVFYEMLTGVRAFSAGSAAETMSAIVNVEPPPVTERNPLINGAVGALVHRCLEKDPHERFQSARDLAFSLSALGQLSGPRPALSAGGHRSARRWAPAAVVGAIALLGAVAAGLLSAGRLDRQGPPDHVLVHRLTDFVGLEEHPAISPDGKSVAFIADAGASRQLFVRLRAGGAALQITRDARSPQYPRWSPDSTSILYYVPPAGNELQGAIWEVPALGGAPRRIVSSLAAGDISHDGKQLAFFQLDRASVRLVTSTRDGTNVKPIAQLDNAWRYLTPRWSPDDRWIAYQRVSVNTHNGFVASVTGGEPRHLIRDAGLLNGLAWLPDGSGLIFSASRGATVLYLPMFNLWTIRLTGDGLRQITFGETSYVHPDLNLAGTLVASRLRTQFDIWEYPSVANAADNTRRGVRVTRQTGHVQTPSAAPTGDHIVYLSDTGGHGNLWVTQITTGDTRQITFEQDPATVMGLPIWSPAGDQIAFYTTRGWGVGYYSVVSPDGSNLRRLIPEGGTGAWSHDGRWFYYAAQVREGVGEDLRLKKIDVRDGTVVHLRDENATSPAPARDGTLYFTTQLPTIAGNFDVEVRAANPEDAAARVLTRIPSDRLAPWQRLNVVVSPDGKSLAVPLTDGATTNIWAISTTDGAFRQLTDFGSRPTFIVRRVSWSADGRWVFAAVGEGDADIVLLAGLHP